MNTIGCADEKWKTEEHELMIDSGCFGHVCPPWFAPQFPMVSSTNVDAVAANNVALQHYGQKVVYGHVMTNSGKRILIQITFDVMNVRKPLLSISALKHHLQSRLRSPRFWVGYSSAKMSQTSRSGRWSRSDRQGTARKADET